MAAPKFPVGTKVNHPACPDGTFPAGTGTIASVIPVKSVTTGKPGEPSYTVKCDATGAVLNHDFLECELTAC